MTTAVFVTLTGFAVNAFEVEALDYLPSKAFDDRGLARVMARVRRQKDTASGLGQAFYQYLPLPSFRGKVARDDARIYLR